MPQRPVTLAQCQHAIDVLLIQSDTVTYVTRAPSVSGAASRWYKVLPDIKSVWRKLVLDCHPDRGGDQRRFVAVQTAWELVQRDDFVACLWNAAHPPAPVAAPPRATAIATNIPFASATIRIVTESDVTGRFTSTSTNATSSVASECSFWNCDPAFIRRF